MLYKLGADELRSICKRQIETFEVWARRLIDYTFTDRYGQDYFESTAPNGERIVKNEVYRHIQRMKASHPGRFQRDVDTLFFKHLLYLFNEHYATFQPALDYIYPNSKDAMLISLKKLVEPRNYLAHSNPISVRQAEQVVCYTNDFIDGVKQYFRDEGLEKMWNVPQILKITDSLGNVMEPVNDSAMNFVTIKQDGERKQFYVGEQYSVEIEVDSSFDRESYSIEWGLNSYRIQSFDNQTHIEIQFEERHIGAGKQLYCKVISNEKWHKYSSFDHQVLLTFAVLPN